MKNIFVICLLLITGLTQAQTFNFSCGDSESDIIEKFGDLLDFLPSTTANAVNLNQTPNIGVSSSTIFSGKIKVNANSEATFNRTLSASSVDETIGGSTIHEYILYLQHYDTNPSSSDDTFDGFRITGGKYHNWVLLENGIKVDVIAKFGEGNNDKVNYAFIVHNSYTWPNTQSSYKIDLNGDDLNNNFDN